MDLSYEVISQFAKVINNNRNNQSSEATVYGVVVEDGNGNKYVKLDGSDQMTPLSDDERPSADLATTNTKAGDRVSVLIKNHTATVTGNTSSPSVRTEDFNDLSSGVEEIKKFDIVIADKVQANEGYIKKLQADKAEIGDLKATTAEIESLKANKAEISDLKAAKAEIEDLKVKKIDAEVANIKYATVENLKATNANIDELTGKHATFESVVTDDLKAVKGNIKTLDTEKLNAKDADIKYAKIQDLNATNANIDNLVAQHADLKNAIVGASSTETGIVINLTAENATISEALIKELIAQYITVNDLKAGNIITDKIKVMSQNGRLQIAGNTFTIYDENDTPIIQLGQDKNGNYGLVISDNKGAILLDSEGLHEGIVPDNFIKTEMVGPGQITEEKIDKTNIRNWTDSDGSKIFDVSKMYYGDDKFEVSYSSIRESVKTAEGDIDELQDTVASLGNGYTVVLSNESQNIPCTSKGITAATFNIEIPFRGYAGIKQAACTVDISGLPKGMTLTKNQPATDTQDGLVVINVQKDADLGDPATLTGNILFACVISESLVSKKFTWTKTLAGEQGSQGVPGVPGENATTYYTWVKYADDDHGVNMSKDPAGKKYIGIAYNKETQTESNNASDYTWSLFRGADGVNGADGKDGESLFTWIKYSNDPNGVNMSDNPEDKKYIGIAYNKSTQTESTNPNDYTWSLIQGADGNDVVFYYLTPSVDVIKKETLINQSITDEAENHIVPEDNAHISESEYDDVLTPSSITFEAHKIVGNNTPVSYACRFVIQESVNGVSYATKYSSIKDETSVTYTPSTTNLYGLKCILYAPGGITTQLDSQTVSVISDSSSVTPAIKAFQQQFKTIDLTIDQMNKEINAKATQQDIEDSINEYDSTTTQKVRDQITEQTIKIGEISAKVSDVQTEITKKADGSTVTELTNRFSKAEQEASGFRQTVEKDYAKTDDVNKAIKSSVDQSAESIKTEVAIKYGTKEDISRVEQKTDSVTTEVQNARGDKATLKERVDLISLQVESAKKDIGKIDVKVDEVKTEVVNARGDKSTLSVRIDAIESSVRDANGNISNVSQKADSIEMKVTNMNVGGRNYILNSRFQGLKETVYNKFEGDSLIFVSTYGANDSACDIVLDCVKDIIYKDGLTLTLSFEYYIDGIENIADGAFIGVELQFVDSAGTSTSQKFPIPNLQATNQWGRYVGQMTNIDPSITNIYVHFIKQQSNGSLKYRHPKLEIGDKVSDYSLAPEDLISSIEDVQNNVDKNYEQSVADLKVLQDRIDSIVVTDESGSQVIQTADGVRWNLTQMQQGINNALDSAVTANGNAENAQTSADQLKDQVNDISQKTAYMEIVQQEDGNPCLELGSSDNDFKVRLTNTSLGFYQGTLRVAYISNQALYIETAIIKYSLQFGETAGFVWRLRENGNFGLQPF